MLAQSLLTLATASLAAAVAIEPRALEPRQGGGAPSWPGAIGFTWPGLRGWDSSSTTTGLCGGFDSPNNRTDFPMTGGEVTLTQSRDAYDLQIAYAVGNPTSIDDYTPLFNVSHIFTGTACFDTPDWASLNVAEGSNVTLKLEYRASRYNTTFYQCADLHLVSTASFTPAYEYSCTNYTRSTQTTSGDNTAISSVLEASATTPAETAAASASPTSSADSLLSARSAAVAVFAVVLATFTLA